VKERDKLIKYLKKYNIATSIHYPIPIHLQPAAKKLGYTYGDFPKTEEQAKKILTLPINQYLTSEQIKYISQKINYFFS
jgi:dTDP-4-amino-4,6-dideoxygalactose transaminase